MPDSPAPTIRTSTCSSAIRGILLLDRRKDQQCAEDHTRGAYAPSASCLPPCRAPRWHHRPRMPPKKTVKPDRSIDPRLIKVFAHPLRVRILAILEQRVASPSEIAGELDASLGVVSYHVRRLEALGLIKLVRTTPRRGAVEHHYRADAKHHIFSGRGAHISVTNLTLDEKGWKAIAAELA